MASLEAPSSERRTAMIATASVGRVTGRKPSQGGISKRSSMRIRPHAVTASDWMCENTAFAIRHKPTRAPCPCSDGTFRHRDLRGRLPARHRPTAPSWPTGSIRSSTANRPKDRAPIPTSLYRAYASQKGMTGLGHLRPFARRSRRLQLIPT